MILIEKKKRPKKLQVGGSILGHGEGFVPIKIATPGFAQTITSAEMPRLPALGRSGGRDSGASIKAQDGFQSDIDYLNNLKSEITKRMTDRNSEVGDSYLNSPEYRGDVEELNGLNQQIAQLKTRKQNFLNNIKGKKIDNNELAIRGDEVLVMDKQSKEYAIVSLEEALREQITNSDGLKTSRYQIQSIGQARNQRAHNVKFNGYNPLGQSLEQIIIDTPDKGDLHKLVQQAFKSAGVMSGDENSILVDGVPINLKEFDDYLMDIVQGNKAVTGQVKTTYTSNLVGLQKAKESLLNSITSKEGLYSTYKNMSIKSLQGKNTDFASMSEDEIGAAINSEITRQLAANMQYFIKEGFKEQYKSATGKGGGSGETKGGKVMIEAPEFMPTLLTVDRLATLETGSAFNAEIMSTLGTVHASVIDNQDLLGGSYDKDEARTLENNDNLIDLIDSGFDPSNAFTLLDGTNLNQIYEGDGYNFAMVPKGAKPFYLHRIPTIRGSGGTVTVDTKWLEYAGKLEDMRTKVKKAAFEGVDILTEAQLKRLDDMVVEEIRKSNDSDMKKFANYLDGIGEEGNPIQFRNMIMFKVIIPEVNTWMSGLYNTGKDKSSWGKYLVKATGGEEKSYENNMPGFEEEVGPYSNLYQTIVFAPAKTIGQIANTTFDNVTHISQDERQYISKIKSSEIERQGQTEGTSVEEHVEAGNVYTN